MMLGKRYLGEEVHEVQRAGLPVDVIKMKHEALAELRCSQGVMFYGRSVIEPWVSVGTEV